MASFRAKNRLEKEEKEIIKIIVTFNSYPTCNLKFPKNSNKIKKIKIYCYAFISSQNRLENAKKERI